jgi:hypothetical protein
MFNGNFWGRRFQTTFVPHLLRLVEVLQERLLPTFDAIDNEADARADAEWERAMHMPSDLNQDPSVFADRAFDVGLEHYNAMSDIRQSLLNIYAPALYHAWEQQLLEFFRREVLHPAEEHNNNLLKLKTVQERLEGAGVDIEKFSSWSKVCELRLLANTVKHADGDSADELRKLRPDIFENLSSKEFNLPSFGGVRRVYTPLSGDDIYVTIGELKEYCSALVTFWSELEDGITNTQPGNE